MKLIVSFLLGYLYALAEIHKARRVFRVALFAASMLYMLEGCATPPHDPPVGIWEGGMRMPTDQACSIDTVNGETVLRACK